MNKLRIALGLLCLGLAAVATDRFDMKILRHGIVCDDLNGRSPINSSGIARLPDGEMLMVLPDSTDMVPPTHNYMLRSFDGGKTWQRDEKPFLTNPEEKVAVAAYMYQLPDQSLLFAVSAMHHSRAPKSTNDLNRNMNIRLFCTMDLYRSTDGGRTLEKIQTLAGDNEFGVSAVNGTLLQLANGDLLLPGYLGTPLKDKLAVTGSGFWRSSDGGKTWGKFERSFTNTPGKRFNEATYFLKDDGTIVGYARWDKPWHPDRDNGDNQLSEELHKIISSDNGKTWSKPVPTDMLAIYPLSLRLKNGVYILFAGKRDDPGRDRTCHVWASRDAENFTDLGPVYYFMPEHRDGLMDSLWGTTGGCHAIFPLDDDTFIAAFNGGNIFALLPYYTYVDSNVIKVTLLPETKTVKADNPLLNADAYRVTGGRAETVLLDGEAVLKVTGPTTLESLRSYPTNPDVDRYRLRLSFKSEGDVVGVNYFGARCFKDKDNVVNPVFWTVEQTKTELAESCRAEDTAIKVKDASKWWRSSYFRVKIGQYTTGRDLGIVRKKNGYYLVQLQKPCGVTYPAGTPVYLQANGTADAFFGGIMRGLPTWRQVDRTSQVKNHAFSPMFLRPGTQNIRLLLRLNQGGDADTVIYIKGLDFEKVKP